MTTSLPAQHRAGSGFALTIAFSPKRNKLVEFQPHLSLGPSIPVTDRGFFCSPEPNNQSQPGPTDLEMPLVLDANDRCFFRQSVKLFGLGIGGPEATLIKNLSAYVKGEDCT